MLASGTTGTIATESEALMQDYKAGDMIGSSPKYLTLMQLIATPVGAAAALLLRLDDDGEAPAEKLYRDHSDQHLLRLAGIDPAAG